MVHITVKERNKKEEFFKKLKSKAEDVLFSIITRLPERLLPKCFMRWLEKYLNKRMAELQREQVQANWNKVYMEQAVKELGLK